MKKYFLGLSAIVIAIASVAFTSPKNKAVEMWYQYVSEDSPLQNNNIFDPSKYELTSEADVERPCEGSSVFCGIFAEPNGDQPTIPSSGSLHTALSNYYNNQSVVNTTYIDREP